MADELKKFKVETDDGTEIETVPVSVVEQLQQQIKEKEVELQKERDKEKNFAALRTKTEKEVEEKSELASRLDALEKQRIADLENNKKALEIKLENAFLADAEGDKDLAEKIKFYYYRFAGDALTDDEINQRRSEAVFLAKRRVDSGSPLSRAISVSGGNSYLPQQNESEDFSRTPEGIEFAKRLGLKFTQNNK